MVIIAFTLVVQFKYIYDYQELWSSTNLLSEFYPGPLSVEELQTDVPVADLEKILNKVPRTESPFKTLGYESPEKFAFVSNDTSTNPLYVPLVLCFFFIGLYIACVDSDSGMDTCTLWRSSRTVR